MEKPTYILDGVDHYDAKLKSNDEDHYSHGRRTISDNRNRPKMVANVISEALWIRVLPAQLIYSETTLA